MDADEVLTGKKKKESIIEDALFSSLGMPVSDEALEEVFKNKPLFPKLNPKPFVKIVDMKGRDRKIHKGIEIGLEFEF